ncbi:MAG TPA: hypothetical protein VIC26_16995 [Marinagarivorans sp.]
MNKVTLAVVLGFLATPALADHWVELKAGYAFGDESGQDYWAEYKAEYSIPSFSAQVYIPSVSVDDGPYREAGFLAKSSTLYFNNQVESVDYTFDVGSSAEYRFHTRETTLGGYGVIGDWLVGGEAAHYTLGGESYAETYLLKGGYYLGEAALLTVGLGDAQVDCEGCDGTIYQVNYHQVFAASRSVSYGLDVNWTKYPGTHDYGVEGTVYITPQSGLSLAANKQTAYEFSATDLSIEYHHFIGERVGLSVSYTDAESYSIEDEGSVGIVALGVQVNI